MEYGCLPSPCFAEEGSSCAVWFLPSRSSDGHGSGGIQRKWSIFLFVLWRFTWVCFLHCFSNLLKEIPEQLQTYFPSRIGEMWWQRCGFCGEGRGEIWCPTSPCFCCSYCLIRRCDSKYQAGGYCLIFQRYLRGWRDDLGIKSTYCSGGGLEFYS